MLHLKCNGRKHALAYSRHEFMLQRHHLSYTLDMRRRTETHNMNEFLPHIGFGKGGKVRIHLMPRRSVCTLVGARKKKKSFQETSLTWAAHTYDTVNKRHSFISTVLLRNFVVLLFHIFTVQYSYSLILP